MRIVRVVLIALCAQMSSRRSGTTATMLRTKEQVEHQLEAMLEASTSRAFARHRLDISAQAQAHQKQQMRGGSIAAKMGGGYAGRGLGPGRYHHPLEIEGSGDFSSSPLRHQARIAEYTSTGQGCTLNVISVQEQRVKEGEEAGGEDAMPWERALYHVGWWTGLNHVKWCSMIDPHPSGVGKDHMLPEIPTHCRQNDALQGAMMSARMLPLRDVDVHFMSCMDGRAEYALQGSPGGDMGEFIRGIAAVEKLIYRYIDPDEVDSLLKRFLEQMQMSGRRYFYMCSDEEAQDAWNTATGLTAANHTKLNPLDAKGRRAYLRKAAMPEHVGSKHLRMLLEEGQDFSVRKAVTEAAIQSFHGIYTNWFDPLRRNLMYVVLHGERDQEQAVIKVNSPATCGLRTPLVVPKIHTVTRTAGSQIFDPAKAKEASDEGLAPGANEEAREKVATGSSVMVYHYVAATHLRMIMARFFGTMYGLDPVQIAAKMNLLAEAVFNKMAEEKKTYVVNFMA